MIDRINITAPINQLGYGIASLNIVKSLHNAGCEVSLFPIGNVSVNAPDISIIQSSINNAKFFDPNAPSLLIWHQNGLHQHVGRGPQIGFPIFELDTFDDLEHHHIQSCDNLFVCSQWAKDIVLNHSRPTRWGDRLADDDIFVVNLGVDQEIFTPQQIVKKNKVVFFNCGKWEIRKGHDILIEAFKIAYDQNKNIELHMMCTNPFNSLKEEQAWRNMYDHESVRIIPRAETQQEVYNRMAYADCGVFPSRAEGWNLELLEMMSIGRHVITTDYSAHTAFCDNYNSTLIPVTELEDAHDGKWFFGKGKWANLNETHVQLLADAMVEFASRFDRSISNSGVETGKLFSWHATASRILSAVSEISSRR
jgi:glycosyltransferase involved in cell wall biosynthesis